MFRGNLSIVALFLGLWLAKEAVAQSSRAEGDSESSSQQKFDGASGASHPLTRSDDKRSVFAGAKMERIQSFDKPFAAAEQSGAEGQKARGQRVSKTPQQFPQEERLPARGSFSWQQGTQLPSQVYKNIPMNSVYLNGENIVGLRNQVLEGVTVRFDAQGNIFIEAPHYEVHHDSSYHPLLPDETPQYSKDVDNTLGTKQRPVKETLTK